MAALLPNPKLFSSQFLADYRNNLPYYFSRPALAINCEKPVWASTISSRWWRECSINFASRRRSRAFSTSATFVSDDEKEDREDEEVDGEEFIPLREMTRWLQNKPAGFGEGKRYDTKAEDKILEEIKLDRKHHIEQNGAPRTREKENAASVKKQEKQKVTEVIKTDPEVRVWNLPKKKNIDRDLWKAFKGFPGIVSINPAVTGNRKTRDPICRGFAFIGFESNDAAYRFVQKYSKQILLFGKAQKQISCDVINVHGVLNSPESSKNSSSTCSNTSELRLSEDEISISNPSHISKSTNGIEPNKEEFLVLPNEINFSLSNNEKQANETLQFNDPMLAYQNRKKIAKRNKTKTPKSSKAHILGSLAKLKIKDRAVLTGVLSKYGEVASAASNEI